MGAAATFLAIVMVPSAVAATALWLPRLVRVLLAQRSRRSRGLAPTGPPLERTAADLRRLMAEHERVRLSRDLALRGRRLAALEGALTDCAVDAARALDLPTPERSGREPLPRARLRQLLGDLADAGLVLPSHDSFGGSEGGR